MEITFDPFKNQSNLAKHGILLADAAILDWDEALTWLDERFDYGELRQCAIVPLLDQLYHVAFIDRTDVRRIISLRKATNTEKRQYIENA